MMDTVKFVLASGVEVDPEDYGLLLKSFDASVPEPKLNLISVSGRDGALDLTDWAGELRYDNRTVNIGFRDMNENSYLSMLQLIYSEKLKIIHSADDDYYYFGRCKSAVPKTRRHITDIELEFVCEPYRLSVAPTTVTKAVSAFPVSIQAQHMSVIPQITLTDACSLTFNGVTKSLAAGTHTVPEFVITRTGGNMAASGSGTITIIWTEGVI